MPTPDFQGPLAILILKIAMAAGAFVLVSCWLYGQTKRRYDIEIIAVLFIIPMLLLCLLGVVIEKSWYYLSRRKP